MPRRARVSQKLCQIDLSSFNRDVECPSVGMIFAHSFSERSAMAVRLQLPRKKAPNPTDWQPGNGGSECGRAALSSAFREPPWTVLISLFAGICWSRRVGVPTASLSQAVRSPPPNMSRPLMNRARSAQRKCTRVVRCCKTMSSCRSTRISAPNRRRDLKQSYSNRMKSRPIAIINRNHVLIRLPSPPRRMEFSEATPVSRCATRPCRVWLGSQLRSTQRHLGAREGGFEAYAPHAHSPALFPSQREAAAAITMTRPVGRPRPPRQARTQLTDPL